MFIRFASVLCLKLSGAKQLDDKPEYLAEKNKQKAVKINNQKEGIYSLLPQ